MTSWLSDRLRILTVVDTFSQFSPAVELRFRFRALNVIEVLEWVCVKVGYPASIRVDQGREFISGELDLWAYTWHPAGMGIQTLVAVEGRRWSIQEVRSIANRLAQRRIQPAHIIAWSCWRRAHQAAARRAHLKAKMQL